MRHPGLSAKTTVRGRELSRNSCFDYGQSSPRKTTKTAFRNQVFIG